MGIIELLSTRDIIIVIGILLAQIPFVIMVKYFYKTGIKDFLIGGLIMFSGSLSLLLTQFFFLGIPALYIIANISFLTTYFLLFLHSIRYKWKYPPGLLLYSGIIIYLIIIGNIFFYQITPVDAAQEMIFGFEMMPVDRKTGGIPEVSALTSINGKIVIGSTHLFFVDIYRLLSSMIFFYAYATTKLSYKTSVTKRNRDIILIIAILNMLHPILITMVGFQLIQLPYVVFNIINVFFIGLLTYIAIFHPETLSLSNVQVVRTLSLYKIIQNNQNTWEEEDDSYIPGMNAIRDYIMKISKLR